MRNYRNDSHNNTTFKSEIRLIPLWIRLTGIKLVVAAFAIMAVFTAIVFAVKPGSNSILSDSKNLYFLIPLAILISLWTFKICREALTAQKIAEFLNSKKRESEELTFLRNHHHYTDTPRSQKPRAYTYSQFCPNCGWVMLPGERICKTCFKKKLPSAINSSEQAVPTRPASRAS